VQLTAHIQTFGHRQIEGIMEGKEINLEQVCNILGKSQRTTTRNIKKSLLNPEKVKSQKGMILLN
jgi:hypothetical protein